VGRRRMTEKPMSFGAFKTMKELCDFYEEKYRRRHWPLPEPYLELKKWLAKADASWPKLCAFYLEEGTGHKDEDKSCENCIYHPDNIHEINDGLTKDEWKSTPCQFPDTKKRIFR